MDSRTPVGKLHLDRRADKIIAESEALNGERLIDTHELAELLGTSRQFVEQLRMRPGGPPFIKIGRAVRYNLGVLLDWLAARQVASTSAYETRGLGRPRLKAPRPKIERRR